MKILGFAFYADDLYGSAYMPHNIEKNSVVYTGTHDNETITGWAKGLKEEDLELFRRLATELGFLDLDMQMRTLELLEMQVKNVTDRLEKGCEASCKMYQSLGILGALAVVIVMI